MQSPIHNQALNSITEKINEPEEMSQTKDPLISQRGTKIWTPPFTVTFTLLTIVGLSAAALLAHIWANTGLFHPQRLYMIYAAGLFVIWAILAIRARTLWIRVGGIFGCIWAIVTGILFWFSAHGIDMQAMPMVQVSMTANSALLGSFICLSVGRSPFRRWDAILFWLLPLILCAYLAFSYVKAPADSRFFLTEEKIATWGIYLSIAVWWLRPSCWRSQAGPAFLFGLAACLLYFLTKSSQIEIENNVFWQQVFFLCLFLGTLRILQAERQKEYQYDGFSSGDGS